MTRLSDRSNRYPLQRRAVVASLLEHRGDSLVVAGLGAAAWDITAAGDTPLNFPLWGAMGGAVPLGLGLALAQPSRQVMVLTGDGEMLMGLGSLATAGLKSPSNLAIIVLDNERYGETGMQSTHTAGALDLEAVAAASGIAACTTIRDQAALELAIKALREESGPLFFNIKVRAEDLPLVLPPRDGIELTNRFRQALLGTVAGN